MVSVVKYFRPNQFQKKLFSRKYFSAFGSHEKITKRENAAVAGIRQRPIAVAGFRGACLAGFLLDSFDSCQIRPDSGHFGQIRLYQWPESGLPASGDGGRISAPG
jgi:hypothetical protein